MSAAAGLALLLVLTRLLGPAAYGRFAVLISFCAIGQATFFFWLQNGTLRLGADPAILAAPGGLFRTVALAFAAASLAAAAAAGLVALSPWAPPATLGVAALAYAYLVGRAATGIVQAWTRLSGDVPRYIAVEALFGIGTVVLSAVGLWLLPGRLAVPLAAGAICGAAALCFLRYPRTADPPPVPLAALWRYGAMLAVVGFVTSLLGMSDRAIVAHYAGDAAAGAYAAAYTVADRGVMLVLGAIAGATRAAVFVAHDRDDTAATRELLRDYAILLLAVGLPAATLLTFGAGPAARLLMGGGMAQPAAALLPWLAPGTLLAAMLTTYFGIAFQVVRRPARMLAALVPAAAGNIAANLILVPAYGAIAAAWSTLGSYALALVLAATFGRRHFALPIPAGAALRLALACVPTALLVRWAGLEATIGPLATLALGGLAYLGTASVLFPGMVARLGRHS